MVLAIDFDGTIHDWKHPQPGRQMGPPMEGAQDALRSFKAAGHTIVIHTVRGGRPQHVREWLDYFAIPYDSVTNIKVPADWYIDDRGMHFTDWQQTAQRVFSNNPELQREPES